MSWGVVAAATVSAGVALYEGEKASSEAKKNRNALEASQEASRSIDEKNLNFQMERYNDWKDIYGDLQESQSEYYENLTGITLAAPQIEQIQLASQKANEKIKALMAQRGIQDSNIETEALQSNIFNTEILKAQVTSDSEIKAQQMKDSFIGLGLGQGQALAQGISNTRNQMSRNETNYGMNTINLNQVSQARSRQNREDLYSSIGTGIGAVSDYYNTKDK